MFPPILYILDGRRRPVLCRDLREWGRWMEENRIRWLTEVRGFTISTIFLGLDHRFGPGPPVLWETMVFLSDGTACASDGTACAYLRRCSGSWEQAEAQHAEVVRLVTDPATSLRLDPEVGEE
jgi:hypothetical protein